MKEKAVATAARDYWAKINATHWNQVNFMLVIIPTSSEKSFVSKWCLLQLRWTWTGCLNTENKPQGLLDVGQQINYQEKYGLLSQEVIPFFQSNPIAHVCIEWNYSEKNMNSIANWSICIPCYNFKPRGSSDILVYSASIFNGESLQT